MELVTAKNAADLRDRKVPRSQLCFSTENMKIRALTSVAQQLLLPWDSSRAQIIMPLLVRQESDRQYRLVDEDSIRRLVAYDFLQGQGTRVEEEVPILILPDDYVENPVYFNRLQERLKFEPVSDRGSFQQSRRYAEEFKYLTTHMGFSTAEAVQDLAQSRNVTQQTIKDCLHFWGIATTPTARLVDPQIRQAALDGAISTIFCAKEAQAKLNKIQECYPDYTVIDWLKELAKLAPATKVNIPRVYREVLQKLDRSRARSLDLAMVN